MDTSSPAVGVSDRRTPMARRSRVDRVLRLARTLVNIVLFTLVAVMFLAIFGNVILRYFFSTGIMVSDEIARFAFIWMVFIGGIIVYWDNEHVGIDVLLVSVGNGLKRVLLVICEIIVLGCAYMLAIGTWEQLPIFATDVAPVTGIAYFWVFGVAFPSGVGIGIISLIRLYRIILSPADRLDGFIASSDVARNGE